MFRNISEEEHCRRIEVSTRFIVHTQNFAVFLAGALARNGLQFAGAMEKRTGQSYGADEKIIDLI